MKRKNTSKLAPATVSERVLRLTVGGYGSPGFSNWMDSQQQSQDAKS